MSFRLIYIYIYICNYSLRCFFFSFHVGVCIYIYIIYIYYIYIIYIYVYILYIYYIYYIYILYKLYIYIIYICIPLHSCDYLYKVSIKINKATDKSNSQNEIWHWIKRWNWSNSTKLALSVSWIHGLIAQLVRASEQNQVVMGSNATQVNFL